MPLDITKHKIEGRFKKELRKLGEDEYESDSGKFLHVLDKNHKVTSDKGNICIFEWR